MLSPTNYMHHSQSQTVSFLHLKHPLSESHCVTQCLACLHCTNRLLSYTVGESEWGEKNDPTGTAL
jgi:hypothetical protein